MDVLKELLHIDEAIGGLIRQFGPWTYGILFLIIFAETGLVVTPFLPGDSLLFAVGIFSVPGKGLDLWTVLFFLTLAPLCGDTVNYHLGKYLGPKIFRNPNSKFLNPKHLKSTEAFFQKHGPKAVIIARWVPIVRTFAPFVAGMGAMEYRRFFGYSLLGAFLWVWGCTLAGYFLGSIPVVKENFELAMLALIAVSVTPIIVEIVKHKREAKAALEQVDDVAIEVVEEIKHAIAHDESPKQDGEAPSPDLGDARRD